MRTINAANKIQHTEEPNTMNANTTRKSAATTIKETVMTAAKTTARRTAQSATPTTKAQQERLAAGAKRAADKAVAEAAREALGITEDPRTVARADKAEAKAVAAKQRANVLAEDAGLKLPFPIAKKTATRKPRTAKAASPKPVAKAAPAKPATYKVTIRNLSDGSVEGHAAGCADLKRNVVKRGRRNLAVDHAFTEATTSKRASWLDYNADFIAEGGEENAWPIEWLPCADHVPAEDAKPVRKTSRTNTVRATKAESSTAAAKPVRKAATKKATPAKPAASDPTAAPKVAALATFAFEQGWSVQHEVDGTSVTVKMTKDAEVFVVAFINGSMDASRMPHMLRADGSKVLLRNVSAVKANLMTEADATKAGKASLRVKREVVRGSRKVSKATGEDAPRKVVPFDIATEDDDVILDMLAGKTLTWRRSMDQADETALLGRKVWMAKANKPGAARIVNFISMMESKRGIMAGPQRSVRLDQIVSVNK